jgi:hypothetical protein
MGRNWLTHPFGMEPMLLLAYILIGLLAVIVFRGMFCRSRFLAICPKVTYASDKMIARTSIVACILSLGLIYRYLVVDARRKEIAIYRRIFWFHRTNSLIPFEDIQEIHYGYEDWGPFSSMGLTGGSKDCFSVKLHLLDQSTVHLFYFMGEGDLNVELFNPLASLRWFLAKVLLGYSGSQDEESRRFIEQLQKLVGVRVSP